MFNKFSAPGLKKLCAGVIVFLALSGNSDAWQEQYKFRRLGIENGLSSNTVHSIIKDKTGFMWFGTEDGLSRYDGYSFVVFRNNLSDSTSLSDNFIWSVYQDRVGTLWIGTNSGGLNRFNPARENFQHYLNDPNNKDCLGSNDVRAIYEDRQGVLWIGTRGGGLNRFDRRTGKFTKYLHDPSNPNSISGSDISCIYEDRSGVLWVGTMGYGLNRFDRRSGRFTRFIPDPKDPSSLSDNKILCIYEDKAGTLWIGTQDGGLNRFDNTRTRFTAYRSSPYDVNTLGYNTISSLFEDQKGNFWAATVNGGLDLFDRTTGRVRRIMNDPSDLSSLSNNSIFSTYEDPNGLLWLGTGGGGVNVYDRKHSSFRLFAHEYSNPNSLSFNIVRSILVDRRGLLWIGTLGGGLNIYDRKTEKYQLIKKIPGDSRGLLNNGVTALCEDRDGYIWIGTWAGGLHRTIPGKKGEFIHYLPDEKNKNSLSSDIIQSLFEDKQGRIWVGTELGLNLLDKSTNRIYRYLNDPADNKTVSDNRFQSGCILQDHYGNLWAGTWGGLNMISSEQMTYKDAAHYSFQRFVHQQSNLKSLSDNRVISINEDKNGNIWIGTYGGGLNRVVWDKNSPGKKVAGFVHYSIRDGLPNNIIFGIQCDEHGNLWLSTNYGLSRFDPVSKTFRNYDSRDGVQSNQFYWGASYRSRDGEMFFGGINGLTAFYPGEILNSQIKAPVVLTSVKKFGDKVLFDEPLDKLKEITLAYHENFISFEFASLDFSNPEKNQYAYMLENFDKDWIYCGTRRYVSYTNLDPGEYVLMVKATNSAGLWNDDGIRLKIIVTPPYYVTWWFRTLMTVFIIVVTLLVHKVRVRSIKKHNNELAGLNRQLKKEINERKKIESELIAAKEKAERSDRLKTDFLTQMSHEIRTPLNSIMSFSSLLKAELQEKVDEMVTTGFDAITRSGRRIIRTIELILNMSEIQTGSYSAQPRRIDISREILPGLYLEFREAAQDKELKFSIERQTDNCVITCDENALRQSLIQLIDNSIKYTFKGYVAVKLSRDEADRLCLQVQDSGIGMSEEYMSRLFEPFSQEEQGYSRSFEGNGLGLALVKKYCDINNAQIKIESRKDKGTEVTLIFPN